MDRTIIEKSPLYQSLKPDVQTPVKRKRPIVESTSPSASEAIAQVFEVATDSDSDEEE